MVLGTLVSGLAKVEGVCTMAEDLEKVPSPKEIIKKMLKLESALGRVPGAKFGDEAFPLRHTFADGLYIREMTGLKGMVVVTKLHKTTHPFFVLKGDVSILTEKGVERIKAPCSGITQAGTKRIGYFHEDTVWITVHATEETDLEKIEEEVIAKTYDELPEEVKKTLRIDTGEKGLISKESEVSVCRGH